MSIYRSGINNIFSDVHAAPVGSVGESANTAAQARAGPKSPAEAARETAERSKRKNGEPLSVPLPRTLAWAAQLPVDIRPHELIRLYARIANQLAVGWEDAAATRTYFDELLATRRPSRQGFPKQVETELLALHKHYLTFHAEDPERLIPWNDVRKR